MKLLLVAEKTSTRDAFAALLRPQGFEFIHYRHPIKAMDNIDEIEPDIVLFSAEDFPRHWKPFMKLLRHTRSKAESAFVLLTADEFSFEEAAKANHLEVNAMLAENLNDKSDVRKLEELVTRYSALREERTDVRYSPDDGENLQFIMTHPTSNRLLTGSIFDLSTNGASFVPDDPKASATIPAGTNIDHCSLNLDGSFFTVSCKVVRNSGRLALRFLETSEDMKTAIVAYVDLRAERELDTLLHRPK